MTQEGARAFILAQCDSDSSKGAPQTFLGLGYRVVRVEVALVMRDLQAALLQGAILTASNQLDELARRRQCTVGCLRRDAVRCRAWEGSDWLSLRAGSYSAATGLRAFPRTRRPVVVFTEMTTCKAGT